MKIVLSIVISLVCLKSSAQVPDTLFTNEHHNVGLFFPDKIRQAVVGAENYIFSYNQEHPQYFGLLKGSPGRTSNLLIITQDGEVYSFIIAHKEKLPELLYFLQRKDAKGSEWPNESANIQTSSPSANSDIRESTQKRLYLYNQAKYYYSTTKGYLKKKLRNGIQLQVNNLHYNGAEVYVVFEIANVSGIDFETEQFTLYLTKGDRQRNSSYQKILQKPLFKYEYPKIIRHGERKRFVCVLPKFTLGKKEYITVELRERNGNRSLKMNFKKMKRK